MIELHTLRQTVAAAITAAMGSAGWRESPQAPGSFGARESAQRLHQGFSVFVPSSADRGERQRTSDGALIETRIVVSWRYQLATGDQVASFDTALEAEADLRKVVRGIDTLQLRYAGSERSTAEGWVSGEMIWTTLHRVALA